MPRAGVLAIHKREFINPHLSQSLWDKYEPPGDAAKASLMKRVTFWIIHKQGQEGKGTLTEGWLQAQTWVLRKTINMS